MLNARLGAFCGQSEHLATWCMNLESREAYSLWERQTSSNWPQSPPLLIAHPLPASPVSFLSWSLWMFEFKIPALTSYGPLTFGSTWRQQ